MGVCRTKKRRRGRIAPAEIWDAACKLVVERVSPCGIYSGPVDPGVNYFILMLEQLGARTLYSCEGHPNNFYVSFEAPLRVAEKIRECGYFSIELEGHNAWSLRINRPIEEKERLYILSFAASSWEQKLGPLKILNL